MMCLPIKLLLTEDKIRKFEVWVFSYIFFYKDLLLKEINTVYKKWPQSPSPINAMLHP